MNVGVIGDVVSVVAERGREEWQQPQARHPQLLQIIQLPQQAGKIADAVAIAVGKAAHVQLVEDRVLIPERVRSANLAVHIRKMCRCLAVRTEFAAAPASPTGRSGRCTVRKGNPPPARAILSANGNPRTALIPSSTYRLQLHSGFTLDDASGVADYLAQLGVSHVYASSYLQAAPGSTHGYDVADHHVISEELGGEEAHQRFCRHLGECGLGQVLDIVPNHMSLAPNNRYWWDVLENGASSRYAEYFDIDWDPAEVRLSNKVLLPILDDQYGVVLADRKIELVDRMLEVGRFEVHYANHSLPISPESIFTFLSPASQACGSDTLAFLSEAFANLGQPDAEDRAAILKRDRDKAVLYLLLERDCTEFPEGLASIDKEIAELNRDGDAMDAFLQQQNYRLAYWRVSDQDLSYRRFFDINSLIGLRVERERVFLETHERILRWLRDGVIDGVRVDHADGLRDPQQYFERLRRTAPNAWVVAEKILQPGEALPASWQVHGTTGYEFLNQVNGLLISAEGLRRHRWHLSRVHRRNRRTSIPWRTRKNWRSPRRRWAAM